VSAVEERPKIVRPKIVERDDFAGESEETNVEAFYCDITPDMAVFSIPKSDASRV